MKYFALDVETANPDYSSICQIGIAEFEDGELIDTYCELINPEVRFDPFNTEIHGITEKDVKKAKKFPQIYEALKDNIQGQIVVHHMPFDKSALYQAAEKYNLEPLNFRWLDSAKVARRTWDEFSHRGYGLHNICKKLNIKFKHHDALEDAIAAGKIVQYAIKETNLQIEDWFVRICQPLDIEASKKIAEKIHFEGNPEGPLHGETIVFTGALDISRREAAQLAADAGCNVESNVTKNCSILVIGQQDLTKLAGKDKSNKQIKAEELIKKGQAIQIISENDFKQIVR